MRKLLPLLALALILFSASNVFSQSQRTVLFEEFTNASCSPCAAANPAFNALLTANEDKVVAIKFQWYYPGFDPMNAQNPTEPDDRMTYYGLNGVPHAIGDGNVYNNHPAYLTQANINTQYATPSPFDMSLTHTLSADRDSIFIRVILECTQAVSGTLVLQTAIEENEIHFATAPGGNGEKDFYDVMRKMLPDINGTTLSTSYAVGHIDTIDFAVALPTYIYDLDEVCVVAFVQDNANKNVKQAARSAPIPKAIDGSLTKVEGFPVLSCDDSLSPTVTLLNKGSENLVSASIHYKLDNNALDSIHWTGNLANGASTVITIPQFFTAPGSHTFLTYIHYVNDTIDMRHNADTLHASFNIVAASGTVPLSEGFVSTTFPPTGFVLNNATNDSYKWQRATTGAYGTSTSSAYLNFYSITSGNYDEMILPPFDMTSIPYAALFFDVAYAQYASENDRLEVLASTNCGATWTSLFNKAGATLATAPLHGSSGFVPTASEWRTESADMTSFVGNSQVLIKFKGTSAYGNNLYVDNINVVVSAAGVSETQSNSVNIYPNPFSDVATIALTLANESKVEVNIYNVVGELVFTENHETMTSGAHQIAIDGQSLPSGMYFVNIMIGNELHTMKLSLTK